MLMRTAAPGPNRSAIRSSVPRPFCVLTIFMPGWNTSPRSSRIVPRLNVLVQRKTTSGPTSARSRMLVTTVLHGYAVAEDAGHLEAVIERVAAA